MSARMERRRVISLALAASLLLASPAIAIERVSVAWNGAELDSISRLAGLSDSGRFVVFSSFAYDVIPGGLPERQQAVYLRDRWLRRTTLLSRNADGAPFDGSSRAHDLSPDARFVLLASSAQNALPDASVFRSLYVLDRDTGELDRIDESADGEAADRHVEEIGSISDDGRWVVFASEARNLHPDAADGNSLFLADRADGTLRVIVAALDDPTRSEVDPAPVISGDGGHVLFRSHVASLVPLDSNGTTDVFVWDRELDRFERVNVGPTGIQEIRGSADPWSASIDGDGSRVAFTSSAGNLAPFDANGNGVDAYLRLRGPGTTLRVVDGRPGVDLAHGSTGVDLDAAGRYAIVSSNVSKLGSPGDDPSAVVVPQVYVVDTATGAHARIAPGDGSYGDREPSTLRISRDGRFVAFASFASNLVPGDGNGSVDVFFAENPLVRGDTP